MAVTSQWSWVNIERAIDYSLSGGALINKPNWALTRMLISNDDFPATVLGSESTSLSGYNGNVTETVTSPSIVTCSWSSIQDGNNWIVAGTKFAKTGYTRNGEDSYYSINYTPLVLWKASDDTTSTFWTCAPTDISTVLGNVWPDRYDAHTDYVRAATSSSKALTTQVGTFVGDATFAVGSTQLKFVCVSDSQQYNQPAVDWYTHVQMWSLRGYWGA